MPPEMAEPERLIAIVRKEADEAVSRIAKMLNIPEARIGRDPQCRLACGVYAARRERRHFFDPKLFADPAWDMLLVLYCAHVGGETLTVSSVVQAAEIPSTTGLRWLAAVEEAGLVERTPHPSDRRAVHVRLTCLALQKMEAYLDRLRDKGLMQVM